MKGAILLCIFAMNLYMLSSRPTDNIWQGWVKRESGKDGYRQVLGDRGNAMGKYQFDRRYGLVPFMKFCKKYDESHYSGFQKFIDMGVGSEELKGNQELAALWIKYCDSYPEEFEALQDVCGYNDYYVPIKNYLMNLYQIDLDKHSPAVKGSAFSMSIRSGPLSAARKFVGLTDDTDELKILEKTYGTYGDADAARWKRSRQLGDAILAMYSGEYTKVPTSMN